MWILFIWLIATNTSKEIHIACWSATFNCHDIWKIISLPRAFQVYDSLEPCDKIAFWVGLIPITAIINFSTPYIFLVVGPTQSVILEKDVSPWYHKLWTMRNIYTSWPGIPISILVFQKLQYQYSKIAGNILPIYWSSNILLTFWSMRKFSRWFF